MAAITSTAVDRGTLVTSTSPDHAAGTDYSIDVKLQRFTEQIDAPKKSHVSVIGNVETVLQRATRIYNIALIWPHAENESMEEFLFSISGGEVFSFDPFGTVAVPDSPIEVVCLDSIFSIGQMRLADGSQPYRSVTMTLRPVVV